MKKFHIWIDLDEIVASAIAPWIALYNEDYKDDLKMEDIILWEFDPIVKPECGSKIKEYILKEGFYSSLKPLDGAIDGLKALKSQGHELTILSSPGKSKFAYKEKREWVERYLGGVFSYRDVMLGPKKQYYHADVIIDDGPFNISAYRKQWPDSFITTIEYPYNRTVKNLVNCYAQDYRNTRKAWETIVNSIDDYSRR